MAMIGERLGPDAPYSVADKRVYDQLRQEMEGTSHGELFSPRPFEDDPQGLFHLENAYTPAYDFDQERFDWLKENMLHPFLITKPSYEALVDTLDETLHSDIVLRHTGPASNGSVAIASNHIAYSDLPVIEAAMTDVNLRYGDTAPTSRHHVIASRLISLFKMPLLKDGEHEGLVVEDGLLWLGGYVQTVPGSASGSRIKQAVGKDDINAPVTVVYNQLLNAGAQFCLAVSGTRDKLGVMDTVSRGTEKMLTGPNAVKGAERLLTIPIFMDCDPFVGGFSGAVDATHGVLAPRFLYDEDDVTHMMKEIAVLGNAVKRPGTPEIAYRLPTMKQRTLGRVVAGDELYKG